MWCFSLLGGPNLYPLAASATLSEGFLCLVAGWGSVVNVYFLTFSTLFSDFFVLHTHYLPIY